MNGRGGRYHGDTELGNFRKFVASPGVASLVQKIAASQVLVAAVISPVRWCPSSEVLHRVLGRGDLGVWAHVPVHGLIARQSAVLRVPWVDPAVPEALQHLCICHLVRRLR